MFDPSELNLDFDDKEKKELNNSSKSKKNINSKKEKLKDDNNNSPKTDEKNVKDIHVTGEDDILNNIDIIETETINKNDIDAPTEDIKKDKVEKESTEEKKQEEYKEITTGNSLEDNTKNNIIDKKEDDEENIEEETKRIIYDINISSLQDVLVLIVDKEYDFVVFEPDEEKVKITFKKDKLDKDIRFIKYPTYSQIIIKAKKITNLEIEQTGEIQEGDGKVSLKNKAYKLISKTVPDNYSEKLFLKLKETKIKVKKNTKKTSLSQIFGFLGAIAFISLVIGGAFIGFVVLNAKTVEDVKFFYSLGINLNDINTFISKIITVIFSILMFIETIFLIIFLFKFSLTKKQFRPKKIRYGIFATIFLIIAFSTGSAWMIIDKKIKSLPNWQEMAYGDVQIYDNSKLISDNFSKGGSLITDTSNIIGPVEIKFDLSFFEQKEEQKGFKVKKFIWNFGIDDEDLVETPNPTIIKNFNKKGNYEVSLIIEETDLKGDIIEKKVDNIPHINISYIVEKNEKKLNNGGKLVDFDASSLKELGNIEWYFFEDLSKPVWKGETFKLPKPIFEEMLVGMYIRRSDKEEEALDKIFIISGEDKTTLDGDILYTRSIDNDLEVELSVNNTNVDFGNGYIEEFKWIIGDKEITKIGDFDNPSESSKIKHIFKNYGEHTVKLILKDSSGDTKEVSIVVDIPKQLKMKTLLKIYNEQEELKDVTYEAKLNEYYVGEIGIPTQIKLDAKRVKGDNLLYTLRKVNWDFDSNGDIDVSEKTTTHDLNSEGNHNISVEYVFEHIRVKGDIITVNETIFLEGVKKEAVIDFEIINSSYYTPTTVQFDASKSTVKDDDIVKFIWDYGDGVSEERDAIVPGHKYLTPGDYTIKLKIVTKNGKEYQIDKQLILKPKPQSIKINTSMKKTVAYQGIDFNSSNSEGQIVGYLWDFGDGNKSTLANPSHSYTKPGKYTVTLKADFSNNNVLEDNIEIEIVEDY